MKISTDVFIPPIVPDRTKSVRLKFEFDDKNPLNIDEFWDFCAQNHKLQIELVTKDELKITFPRGFRYSEKSVEILMQLSQWEKTFQTGRFFNHLIGYNLPNGLIYSPSFSWIKKERFESLSEEHREKLIHLCPDFVIELILFDEDLPETQKKCSNISKTERNSAG
jgi:Uma2 family endonuclease